MVYLRMDLECKLVIGEYYKFYLDIMLFVNNWEVGV